MQEAALGLVEPAQTLCRQAGFSVSGPPREGGMAGGVLGALALIQIQRTSAG